MSPGFNDSLRTHMLRQINEAFDVHRPLTLATVQGYNPTTHTARVTFQPEGDDSADLPIIIPFNGHRASLDVGMTVLVALIREVPIVILGAWYDDNNPPPSGAFVFQDDVMITGTLFLAGPLIPMQLAVLPPATSSWANAFVALLPTDTVDGALWYCQPTHTGTYVWRQLSMV